ncbi:hypothetical protein ES703_62234 [subsurface metagenome]
MIKVCEFELKCCPYCGSKRIEENDKLRPPETRVHAVICLRCMGIFFIPCED